VKHARISFSDESGDQSKDVSFVVYEREVPQIIEFDVQRIALTVRIDLEIHLAADMEHFTLCEIMVYGKDLLQYIQDDL
jgi:hypothetical protein